MKIYIEIRMCCKISKQKNQKWMYYFLETSLFLKVFSIFINLQNLGNLNERFFFVISSPLNFMTYSKVGGHQARSC